MDMQDSSYIQMHYYVIVGQFSQILLSLKQEIFKIRTLISVETSIGSLLHEEKII